MKLTRVSEEVWYTTESITTVSRAAIEELRSSASGNRRRQARLCTHESVEDPVHEMLIVMSRGSYVRPHLHVDKSESFHVVEGDLQVLLFDEHGCGDRVISMGEYASGRSFYYRISERRFHSVIPVTEWVVFHETTRGPFDPANTVYPAWAPAADEPTRHAAYMHWMDGEIDRLTAQQEHSATS